MVDFANPPARPDVGLPSDFSYVVRPGATPTLYRVPVLPSASGTAGVGIASASVNTAGHLILTRTDTTTVDAGYVVGAAGGGAAGLGIASAAINSAGHLILTRTDASTVDAGVLPAGSGTAYTLPPATAAALGGFKPGTTLASTADGTTDVVGQTVAQITTVTTPSGTPYVVLFQADGTPAKITLTALQALTGWSGGAGAGVPTLTLTMPTGVQPGTSYTISGTFSNDGTSPVLTVSVDAGAFGALPAGSSATSGLITLSMPGLATGTHTVQVKDGNGVLSNTVSFAVAASETLTVTTPGAQVAGTGFAVAGTYANGTPATLDYSLDGGTTWTAASGPTISGGSYSIPGVVVPAANASQTVRVRDHGAQSVVGVSGAFAVTAVVAAAAVFPITYAGTAGALTGNQVQTALVGHSLAGVLRDGSGNVTLSNTANQAGTLDAAGVVGFGTLTATFAATGPRDMDFFFNVSADRNTYYRARVESGTQGVAFFAISNGVEAGTYAGSIGCAVDAAMTSIGIRHSAGYTSGATDFHVLRNGVEASGIISLGNFPNPGMLAIGSGNVGGAKLSQVAFA